MSGPRTNRGCQDGKSGQVWVEHNYEAKQAAKKANGGQLPYSPSLVTTAYPNDDVWSEDNLPDVLFYLLLPPSRFHGQKIQHLMEDGQPVKSEEGNNIRDFEILPRRISLDAPGWLIEAWRRIDTRISYRDILDRQVSDPTFGGMGLRKLSKNALQNHCRRDCRKVLNCWLEYGRRGEPHRTEVEAIENLSYQNVVYNTNLVPCVLAPHRLVKVRLVRHFENGHFIFKPVEVTAENIEVTTFPLNHFVRHLPERNPAVTEVMTPAMLHAWTMLLKLSERAAIHKLLHWSKLNKTCLPATWFDRCGPKSKVIENTTFDGGCKKCTWSYGKLPPLLTVEEEHKSGARSRGKKRTRAVPTDSDADSVVEEPSKRVKVRGRRTRCSSTEGREVSSKQTTGFQHHIEDLEKETSEAEWPPTFKYGAGQEEEAIDNIGPNGRLSGNYENLLAPAFANTPTLTAEASRPRSGYYSDSSMALERSATTLVDEVRYERETQAALLASLENAMLDENSQFQSTTPCGDYVASSRHFLQTNGSWPLAQTANIQSTSHYGGLQSFEQPAYGASTIPDNSNSHLGRPSVDDRSGEMRIQQDILSVGSMPAHFSSLASFPRASTTTRNSFCSETSNVFSTPTTGARSSFSSGTGILDTSPSSFGENEEFGGWPYHLSASHTGLRGPYEGRNLLSSNTHRCPQTPTTRSTSFRPADYQPTSFSSPLQRLEPLEDSMGRMPIPSTNESAIYGYEHPPPLPFSNPVSTARGQSTLLNDTVNPNGVWPDSNGYVDNGFDDFENNNEFEDFAEDNYAPRQNPPFFDYQ